MTLLRPALIAAVSVLLLAPTLSLADRRDEGQGREHREEHYDVGHGHNHYYPNQGVAVRALPRDIRVISFRGGRYWFSGGVWYARRGPRFVVIAPPVGIFVPLLPAFASVVVIGGTQYYYANETYYLYHPDLGQYEVVGLPPAGAPGLPLPPPGPGLAPAPSNVFVYQKNGQSEEQQARDKYECHRWAADQTGFDPTGASGGVPPADVPAKRADYVRAQQACLEARGYTVR
jgi:hypothetical protein